jgi:hypothetical protein
MQAFLYRHLVPACDMPVRVTAPVPVKAALQLPRDGVLAAVPGREIRIPLTVTYMKESRGGVKLSLNGEPKWIKLKTKYISRKNRFIILNVDAEAPADELAGFRLDAVFTTRRSPDDPLFNPVLKWRNRIEYKFTLAGLTVRVNAAPSESGQ